MKFLQDAIGEALKAAIPQATYAYPTNWNSLPAVAYREISNTCASVTNEGEIEQNVAYQIDVWANNPRETWELMAQINEVMGALNFVREASQDLYEVETRLYHRVSTYRAELFLPENRLHR